ncbi:cupin domain-containing protein [Thermostichus vulcanus]|uniref:Cupin domain-containing protein n=1 Tax=Thermostichus vulcanus str. 'Rupite' TaxID=2813851 RepID=A0ABT0CCA9_THEVL|nr:cupin domain-containing protein [Thermostichus vulcanus]MCJ2543395.1 cupin domain-containing protein [Thermostichus vulcanus str. 'Rupite']
MFSWLSLVLPLPLLNLLLKQRLSQQVQATPLPSSFFSIRAADLKWQKTPIPGIRIAKLYENPQTREVVGLLEADAGAVYPHHQHVLGEEIYMLEGDLVIEDQVFLAGDFIRYGPGSAHRAHTQGGCRFHFRTSMDDSFLESLPFSPFNAWAGILTCNLGRT